MELHEKIKHYRKAKNMSQYDLAEKLNITQNTISLMENGKADLTLSRIYELAKIFEVTIYDLIGYPEGSENTDLEKLAYFEKKNAQLRKRLQEIEELTEWRKQTILTLQDNQMETNRYLYQMYQDLVLFKRIAKMTNLENVDRVFHTELEKRERELLEKQRNKKPKEIEEIIEAHKNDPQNSWRYKVSFEEYFAIKIKEWNEIMNKIAKNISLIMNEGA